MNLFNVHQLAARNDGAYRYSAAFPLEPRGVGSGQLECLTGYVMRLADFHSMTTGSFMNQVLKPLMIDSKCPKYNFNSAFRIGNGFGCFAKRLCESVTRATSEVGARFLTFMPWSNIVDRQAHGLLKAHLEWCTTCWQEDAALGESPYIRLTWLVQSVAICPHHHRALHSFCPHCGNHQRIFHGFPRPWICQSCGASLIEARRGQHLNKTQGKKDYWVSMAIERLIGRTNGAGLYLPANSLKHALQHLVLTHAQGSFAKLSRYTEIDPIYLKKWSTGQTHPSLTALLDLCYRIDVPPDALLLDGPSLTSPDNWRKTGKPHFVSLVKLNKFQLGTMKATLQQIITKNPDPPPLISDVAESLGITFTVLNYHFPDEYRIIKQRSVAYRQYLRTVEGKIRMEKFVASVEALLDQGIYPSERQLKQLGYVRSGDLRRPELIEKLRELQNKYEDCPIAVRVRRHKSGKVSTEIGRRKNASAK